MKKEMYSSFKVIDVSKGILNVESFEDKFFFVVNSQEFTLRFFDKRYGAFLSYDHRDECVSEFIFPEIGRDVNIKSSHGKGLVIFIPLEGMEFDELKDRKKINTYYGVIIKKIRDSFSEDDYKKKVEINGIIGLVLISLIESQRERTIDKIVAFIKSNITNERLSLEYVANNLYMSKRKLQYIFSSNGTTYKKTLNQVKIDLLAFYINENPEVSIKHILPLCGFNSHSSATSIFKRAKGESLYKYQKRIISS
ncbi:helix-turn-helix domain-containing protein [Vibrio jasicida]|uniref:helix-turn-helix domain-containing protein n=1 Tax=Vibrio jasicida TaxID=766224 RepID=UPI0040697C51